MSTDNKPPLDPFGGESEGGTPGTPIHQSVMVRQVLELLDPQPGHTVVDATVGAGGHSLVLCERIHPGGRLVGMDQDPTMLDLARPRLAAYPVHLVHASFEDLPTVLQKMQIGPVDAILADLGFCSDQLANPMRGLSFHLDGPLDMRLDPTMGLPARDLVRRLQKRELVDIFRRFGEERFSGRIARRIVEARKIQPLETTAELAELIRSCVPRRWGPGNIDPATRVFQALRIAVNDELGSLERFLSQVPGWLKPGGRIGVISFHSLEDRLVKQAFRNRDLYETLTRKPWVADENETRMNPRSRSAKLRVAQRLGT